MVRSSGISTDEERVINDIVCALSTTFLQNGAGDDIDLDHFLRRMGDALLDSALASELPPQKLNDPVETLNHTYAIFRNTNHANKILTRRSGNAIFVRCEHLFYWNAVSALDEQKKPMVPQFIAGFTMAFLEKFFSIKTRYTGMKLLPDTKGIESRLEIVEQDAASE